MKQGAQAPGWEKVGHSAVLSKSLHLCAAAAASPSVKCDKDSISLAGFWWESCELIHVKS
jgi:hypothetical protein